MGKSLLYVGITLGLGILSFFVPFVGKPFGPMMLVSFLLALSPMVLTKNATRPVYLWGLDIFLLVAIAFFFVINLSVFSSIYFQDIVLQTYLFLLAFSFAGFTIEVFSKQESPWGLWSPPFIAFITLFALGLFVFLSLSFMCSGPNGC